MCNWLTAVRHWWCEKALRGLTLNYVTDFCSKCKVERQKTNEKDVQQCFRWVPKNESIGEASYLVLVTSTLNSNVYFSHRLNDILLRRTKNNVPPAGWPGFQAWCAEHLSLFHWLFWSSSWYRCWNLVGPQPGAIQSINSVPERKFDPETKGQSWSRRQAD